MAVLLCTSVANGESAAVWFPTVIYLDFFLAIEKAMTKSNKPHLLFMNLQLIDHSSIPNNFPSLSNKYDVCEAAEKCWSSKNNTMHCLHISWEYYKEKFQQYWKE